MSWPIPFFIWKIVRIILQVNKVIFVLDVKDLSEQPHIARELMLIKVI